MTLLVVLDFIGTFIFAILGAFRALKYQLDILGVIVLSVITGLGGGIIRDLVLGVTPPIAFQNEAYFLICAGGAVLTIFWGASIARFWFAVKIIDAAGLAAFAVQGALMAWYAGYGPVGVVLMGTVTAVGGGVLRDILVREMPAILIREVYATAAALGAFAVYLTLFLNLTEEWALATGLVVAFGLRLMGFLLKWELPRVKRLLDEPSKLAHRIKQADTASAVPPLKEKSESDP